MKGLIVKITQILMYPFWHFVSKYFYKSNVINKIRFKKNENYIFVPNHPNKLDPFIIFYSLPFWELKKILPMRFMTAKKYMDTPIKKLFMELMGCYEIQENVLKSSIKLLKKNNLCVFIQGKIDKDFKPPVKVGAVYIHKKSEKSYLVPINISYAKNLNVEIIFIDKIQYKDFERDLQPLANNLLEIIKNETKK